MHLNMSYPSVQIPPYIFIIFFLIFYTVYNISICLCVFFIWTKIKNTVINILCTIFTYKDEGGSYNSGL